ncbi:hypothetical protein GWI33_009358 [Rhynchophorus ferrugineus]|uniref:Uncharacterized protein n=1 Tax=Rhynchophorus ferrugineus TaxID=354439 RepID=A0A834IXX1_RHYFE|nr:hypothetical protein GWI33_009358 [Rhynchophorus ferrugineus]
MGMINFFGQPAVPSGHLTPISISVIRLKSSSFSQLSNACAQVPLHRFIQLKRVCEGPVSGLRGPARVTHTSGLIISRGRVDNAGSHAAVKGLGVLQERVALFPLAEAINEINLQVSVYYPRVSPLLSQLKFPKESSQVTCIKWAFTDK